MGRLAVPVVGECLRGACRGSVGVRVGVGVGVSLRISVGADGRIGALQGGENIKLGAGRCIDGGHVWTKSRKQS